MSDICKVNLSPEGANRLQEVMHYLSELPSEDPNTHKALESFQRQFLFLITQNQDHDGGITIYSDFAPLSFFWKYEESSYHGGLIFHPNHPIPEEGPTFGVWSIHT